MQMKNLGPRLALAAAGRDGGSQIAVTRTAGLLIFTRESPVR